MSLITSLELVALENTSNLVILDASMPPVGVDLPSVAMPCYIPGARRFDIGDFSDPKSELPHMLLSPQQFEQKARNLGINKNSKVVIYDNIGAYSSPRAWWNFKIMGMQNVYVLDGGLQAWIDLGLPTVKALASDFSDGDFQSEFVFSTVIGSAGIIEAMEKQSVKIIDVRSSDRFLGVVEEPRAGLRRGHIPGSFNIPFTDFYQQGKFKSAAQLDLIFKKINSGKNEQLVFSCGSGVTACIGILAASLCGYSHMTLYDGSWVDWATNLVLPVE